jgi:hypothetical protein
MLYLNKHNQYKATVNKDQSAFPDVNDPVLHAIEARNVDASEMQPRTMEAVKQTAPQPVGVPRPPVAQPVKRPVAPVAPSQPVATVPKPAPVTAQPSTPKAPYTPVSKPTPPPVKAQTVEKKAPVKPTVYPTFDYFASQPKPPVGKKVAATVVMIVVIFGAAAAYYFFFR